MPTKARLRFRASSFLSTYLFDFWFFVFCFLFSLSLNLSLLNDIYHYFHMFLVLILIPFSFGIYWDSLLQSFSNDEVGMVVNLNQLFFFYCLINVPD